MSHRYIRVYRHLDIDEIAAHLIICGDLTATCGHCKAINLKNDMPRCPECNTDFKYIAFRNVKQNMPKIQKIIESSPEIVVVDYEDFARLSAAIKAEKFLK